MRKEKRERERETRARLTDRGITQRKIQSSSFTGGYTLEKASQGFEHLKKHRLVRGSNDKVVKL